MRFHSAKVVSACALFNALGCSSPETAPTFGVGGSSPGGSSASGGSSDGFSTGGTATTSGGSNSVTGGVPATATGGIPSTSGGATSSGGAPSATGGIATGTGGASGAGTSGGKTGTTSGGISSGGSAGTAGMLGAAGAGGNSAGCGKVGKTGTFQAQISAASLDRGYYLSVPAAYDPETPYALIFGYHGSNYTGQKMRTYLDLEKAPLVGKTIFVYPDGLPLPNEPDNIAWELTEGSRDLVFFDELFKKLGEEYCIDLNRVFANGQSYGGLMTNAVGCLRGDVLRAIAVVAGSGPRGTGCRGQVAAWLTHGTDDDAVSFASGEKSRDFWVKANHCTTTTVPGTPAQCQNYEGCDAGYPVIWCPHTADGGHQHPSFGRVAVRDFFATFY